MYPLDSLTSSSRCDLFPLSAASNPVAAMATDYASLKVPELKKLLSERGLAQTGNKADLIARLKDNDEASSASKPARMFPRRCSACSQRRRHPLQRLPLTSCRPTAEAAEDEIDWDDDQPAEAEPKKAAAAAPTAAAAPGPEAQTAPAPEAQAADAPAEQLSTAIDATPAVTGTAGPELGQRLAATDAEEEAKKRAARAKRFGLVADEDAAAPASDTGTQDEETKRAKRAQRFGLDSATLVKGLDAALPDRPRKRGRAREGEGEGTQARAAKRATPDRRDGREGGRRGGRGGRGERREGGGGRPTRGALDDPEEKRKAEARAKRFAT